MIARTGFHVDDLADGSLLSICFTVERARTHGEPRAGSEPLTARFRDPDALFDSDEPTRSVSERRVEAAFEALDGD